MEMKRNNSYFTSYTNITNSSISTTAENVCLADSAQIPRVQAKYTIDSAQVPRVHVQVQRGDSRGVLGHGRGVLELKLHEEDRKYFNFNIAAESLVYLAWMRGV